MFTFVLLIVDSVLNAVSVLTPSVVCFILWRIQTPNRPPTPCILFDSEKICGTGEVYLIISRHKTRTDVRTKLNFPLCALEFMQLMCGTVNGFAVAVGREWENERVRRMCVRTGEVLLFLLSLYLTSLRFASFDKTTLLFVCKGFIGLIYIINFNFPSMVVIIYIIYII